ncbi:class I tRNA ligase family protein, partial [archaeon]|nr:class I tRNA ligase family protein [archaeon]
LTKLWNVSNFVSQFDLDMLLKGVTGKKAGKEVGSEELDIDLLDITLTDMDKWVIGELNIIVKYSREQYEKYDFHNPAVMIRHFLWETFASHYLELAKSRAYNQERKFDDFEQRSAIFTLHYCLNTILKLMAPITPFITHTLYSDLYGKDMDSEKFPKHMVLEESMIKTEDIMELNYKVWKAKKDNKMSLKSEIKELVVPEKFGVIEKDITATHNVLKIVYGKAVEVKI